MPVARRLISRGVHPAAGLAFMLAAPILNPIVLLSTYIAYSGRGLGAEMVLGRTGLGLVVAAAAGFVIARSIEGDVLRPRSQAAHDHHDHGTARGKREAFTDHLSSDFLFMGKFIVIGAAVAATMQTVIPQNVVSGVAGSAVIGPLALMGIAFMLSLCSEADAFVAVSFTAFPLGSHLAFLVFGPIVDTKLAILYGATFRRQFVLRLLLAVVPLVLVGSIVFEALI